jgi:hypothetical protein
MNEVPHRAPFMTPELFELLAVSAVTMGLSQTITRERIFAPLRDRLGGKETWFGYLVSCPYCCSHYIAFVLVPLTGAYYIPIVVRWGVLSDILRWFLSSILVVVIAAFMRVVFYFLDESQGLVKREQKKVEVEVESATANTDGPRGPRKFS